MRSVWIGVCAIGFSLFVLPNRAQDHVSGADSYSTVRPVFEAHCGKCHMGVNHRSGLSLETRASILQGGHHGAAIVPGNPADSLLIKVIRQDGLGDDQSPMPPPPREKLSDDDIAAIERWIKAGAPGPQEGSK